MELSEKPSIPMILNQKYEADPDDVYYFIEWIEADKYDQYLDAGYIHAKFYFMDREAEWGKLRRQLEKEEVLHRVAELARLS
jgi:hypothetical protein|tara:strand:- start:211 stop:456 length:246 start_codon:yes stop_codon:yes gene_type:complete